MPGNTMSEPIEMLWAQWPAPAQVKALTTTRRGGVSAGPYASLNLAGHVGDEPANVAANRARLSMAAHLPAEPAWLDQVHGVRVIDAAAATPGVQADGSYARMPGVVCAVLTADCLPVFLCDRDGTRVAMLHAGWRGLAAGIVEQGVAALALPPARLLAYLGPAIGPRAFEVGPEVKATFVAQDGAAQAAFAPGVDGRYWADLYLLARQRLAGLGVDAVYGGDRCTHEDGGRFFSYRRDGRCGRMASMIWIEAG